LYIDGKRIHKRYVRIQAGQRKQRKVLGIRKSDTSVLPFKFQELQLVGALPQLIPTCPFLTFVTEDPDLFETAPVVPEVGMVEVRAFRVRIKGMVKRHQYGIDPKYGSRLHQGQVSERSKQAGRHHVGYTSQATRPVLTHL